MNVAGPAEGRRRHGAGRTRFLRRAARLRGRDLRDFLLAQVAVLAVHWRMWRQPTGQLVAPQSAALAAAAPAAAALPPRVEQLRIAVARAARFGITRPACLTRALALHRLLEREGYTGGTVRIGVRREGGSFAAHAWVDYAGVTLDLDPSLSRPFVPLTDARPTRGGDAA